MLSCACSVLVVMRVINIHSYRVRVFVVSLILLLILSTARDMLVVIAELVAESEFADSLHTFILSLTFSLSMSHSFHST
jgi:hypothetical protein